MVLGHVVIFGEEVDSFFGDLEVEVGIPGKDLKGPCISISHFFAGIDYLPFDSTTSQEEYRA